MNRRATVVAIFLAVSAGALRSAGGADKEDEVAYQVHDGYFESNKSGLKGDTSFLAFTDQKSFDRVFGVAAVMRKKQNFLPKNAFESRLVAAVVKRGGAVWTYKVDKVTAANGKLYVQYQATSQDGGGATFASPLIVSMDRGKYSAVVFIENGKQVGTANISA